MKQVIDKICFIILNYNSYDMTIQCYKNLKKLDDKIKIIIVDNNSSDDSSDNFLKLKEPSTKILLNKSNLGYAAGNNIGLRYISHNMPEIEVVFIINPDIIIDKIEYIYQLYNELLANNELATITSMTIYNGKYYLPNTSCWHFLDKNQVILNSSLLGKIFKKNLYYSKLELNDKIAYVDVIQGCFFGIKMDVIKKINYLDERTFLYCEEQILGRKIYNAGMKSAVLIDTYIYHNHFEKDKELMDKKKRIFHMNCLKNSRKVLLNNYLNLNKFQKVVRNIFLDIDMFIKKIIIISKFF